MVRKIDIKRMTVDEENWKPSAKKENGIQIMVKKIGLDRGFKPEKFGRQRKMTAVIALGLRTLYIDGKKRPLWYSPGYQEIRFLLSLIIAVNGEEEVGKELGIQSFTEDLLRDAKYIRENQQYYDMSGYREVIEKK